MAKIRILVFISTILIVTALGIVASYYARGYKFDFKTRRFSPNGILVVNSEPNGAQIYIDGTLKTATSANISVAPGEYNIEVKKDGFLTWSKKMIVQKEVVTQIDAVLFPAAPSLSALTFAGVVNPVSSPDATKVAYMVPVAKGENGAIEGLEKAGLWVSEVVSFPIGFNREPKRITDGDLSNATWIWSPDGREILLTVSDSQPVAAATTKKPVKPVEVPSVTYLLEVPEFTPFAQLEVQNTTEVAEVKARWKQLEQKQLAAAMNNLPNELEELFLTKTTNIVFSPDQNKILYTASQSASIPIGLVKELPGASTQIQTREIKEQKKYIYDVKEDRNFEIADATEITYWLPTSRHIIVPQKDKIVIKEYDGTNSQTVYSGSYLYPHAYPYTNSNKLLILTTLGATDSIPNLYSLNLK